jgi:AcrR family transcriptional regulator
VPESVTDHRRAVAQRNLEAILDAAEVLLERRAQASISAVAAEADVSRVTVYAHFPTREQLLEAVVERAVRGATTALDAAEPESGPADEALVRLIEASWRELERHHAIASAAAEQLSPDALRRSHEGGALKIRALVERGRSDGTFRDDVPTDWLVVSFFALIHAAADEVRGGRLKPAKALEALTSTMRDMFAGTRRA